MKLFHFLKDKLNIAIDYSILLPLSFLALYYMTHIYIMPDALQTILNSNNLGGILFLVAMCIMTAAISCKWFGKMPDYVFWPLVLVVWGIVCYYTFSTDNVFSRGMWGHPDGVQYSASIKYFFPLGFSDTKEALINPPDFIRYPRGFWLYGIWAKLFFSAEMMKQIPLYKICGFIASAAILLSSVFIYITVRYSLCNKHIARIATMLYLLHPLLWVYVMSGCADTIGMTYILGAAASFILYLRREQLIFRKLLKPTLKTYILQFILCLLPGMCIFMSTKTRDLGGIFSIAFIFYFIFYAWKLLLHRISKRKLLHLLRAFLVPAIFTVLFAFGMSVLFKTAIPRNNLQQTTITWLWETHMHKSPFNCLQIFSANLQKAIPKDEIFRQVVFQKTMAHGKNHLAFKHHLSIYFPRMTDCAQPIASKPIKNLWINNYKTYIVIGSFFALLGIVFIFSRLSVNNPVTIILLFYSFLSIYFIFLGENFFYHGMIFLSTMAILSACGIYFFSTKLPHKYCGIDSVRKYAIPCAISLFVIFMYTVVRLSRYYVENYDYRAGIENISKGYSVQNYQASEVKKLQGLHPQFTGKLTSPQVLQLPSDIKQGVMKFSFSGLKPEKKYKFFILWSSTFLQPKDGEYNIVYRVNGNEAAAFSSKEKPFYVHNYTVFFEGKRKNHFMHAPLWYDVVADKNGQVNCEIELERLSGSTELYVMTGNPMLIPQQE